MSRYIDADALHKAYIELRNFKQDTQTGDWISLRAVPLTTVIKILNDAPSIDIVFCRECHWARPRSLPGETGYRCVLHRIWKGENGFCDSGDRKEGE